jgi:hypothetical protein
MQMLSQHDMFVPEYPHNPAAHLNSPTAIRINGRISHCDKELLAGHNKAARGYVGLLSEDGRTGSRDVREACSPPLPELLIFRRGLWGDDAGPAMSNVTD